MRFTKLLLVALVALCVASVRVRRRRRPRRRFREVAGDMGIQERKPG